MTIRTGNDAIAWAKNEHNHNSRNWRNECLIFVHDCFNVGAKYPSAEAAYYQTTKRHTSFPPPSAVPIWWTNGRYGHVALSAGGGYCWSTDFKRVGYVDLVRIEDITAGWGATYRGWTEDINDVTVYTPPPKLPTVSAKKIARAARHNLPAPKGKLLKAAVAAEVGRGNMAVSSSILGRGFRKQYALVQAKYLQEHGAPVNKSTADGVPGAGSLAWLGNKHGFNVTS